MANCKKDKFGILDARLWADRGAARAFELRASAAAVSAANPRYTGTAAFFAMALQPSGGHGEISTTSITLKPSGTAPTLVRATS